MALNDITADILGAQVSAALLALSPLDQQNPVKTWQVVFEKLYAALKTDAIVNTTVNTTVAPGITCMVDPISHVGATTGAGTGTGSGVGTLS